MTPTTYTGHVNRNGKKIPVMGDLLRDLLRAKKTGFKKGHPIREALRDLIRIERPFLEERIAKNKAELDARNRKPTQMRLW